ncbi:DUF4012 domain-containing protein [Microbacterium sp. NIBRBAC000506063]|uniref:DUF4012 domain-containing protein n=1 Tax=Microbacterium sp. NIBRBAC000506063 TaxID=2734618 RepID=UPI001BB5D1AC|nr:DUF4012 domain-containing protein [Microbacterium sp. NIBRBAC000506063]QTV80720.1 DUF4012 domain-containing protein [Microbacterium sp. NIBRBAC000506063]
MSGSFAELRADAGALTLTRQADSSIFPHFAEPILDVPESTVALYGNVLGRYVQNASMAADFETTAALVSHWWDDLTGSPPDTIISVDPAVLRALLSVTGPIPLGGQEPLTAENMIETLLVEPYRTLDPGEQTDLFESAVIALVDQLVAGDVEPMALLRALAEPAAAGSLTVWSADADTAAVLASSTLGGPSARQAAAGDGAFAVYFNDRTGGKMARLLRTEITAALGSCRDDAHREVVVTVTLHHDGDPSVASLPVSVTGGGYYGVPAGDIGTKITVAAPVGAFFGAVSENGAPAQITTAVDAGHPSVSAQLLLSPGRAAPWSTASSSRRRMPST